MHTIVCIPAPGRAPLCTDACRSPERGLGVGHGREWGAGVYIGFPKNGGRVLEGHVHSPRFLNISCDEGDTGMASR